MPPSPLAHPMQSAPRSSSSNFPAHPRVAQSKGLLAPTLRASSSQRTSGSTGSWRTICSSLRGSPVSIQNVGLQNLTGQEPIIAVMGPTSAGKSTFIKVATGSDDVQIGDDLTSCTRDIQVVRCFNPLQDCDVLFVDTPGFDDTVRTDLDIMRGLADWLEKTYRSGIKLSGILYLHRITDNRMTKTLLRNLDLFRKLCGDDTLSNIRLVTTNWDLLPDQNVGKKYEQELCDEYWKPFIKSGAQVHRFHNTCASAWSVVNSLPMERKAIQMQKELVDYGKPLSRTTGGQSLLSLASEALKGFVTRPKHLIKKVTSSRSSSGKLQNHYKKYRKELRDAHEDLRRIERERSSPKKWPSWRTTTPNPQNSVRDISDADSLYQLATTLNPQNSVCNISDADSPYELATKADVIATETLTCTVQTLKTALASVAGLPIPGLAATIAAALRVAELLKEMRDTDRTLVILINNVSCFIRTICEAERPVQGYPPAVVKAIEEFSLQLEKTEQVARKIKDRGWSGRQALDPDDKRVIIECNDAIKLILQSLGIRIGLSTAAQNEDMILKLNQIESLVTRMPTTREEEKKRKGGQSTIRNTSADPQAAACETPKSHSRKDTTDSSQEPAFLQSVLPSERSVWDRDTFFETTIKCGKEREKSLN